MQNRSFLILVALCSLIFGNAHCNNWNLLERADVVLQTYENLVSNFALTVEDASNTQKRLFSIICLGILKSAASDSDGDASDYVDTSQPADVIGGQALQLIDLYRSIVDPPINVIQASCSPEMPCYECTRVVYYAFVNETAKCCTFIDHVVFFDAVYYLFSDEDFKKLFCRVKTLSKTSTNDDAALDFLNEYLKGTKYQAAKEAIQEWYAVLISGNYTCNLPPLTNKTCCGSTSGNSNSWGIKNKKPKKPIIPPPKKRPHNQILNK